MWPVQPKNQMNWDDLKVFLEVARAEKLSDAAIRLGVNASTVSRRLHKLEDTLKTQLFERSIDGHELTEHGKLLLQTAREIEDRALATVDTLQGKNQQDVGNVRLGATEAFGTFFIAPELARFCKDNPKITIDLLPLQRFVKWSRHEVDLAVTVERPVNTSLIISKLCDYRLKLYATGNYLQQHEPIRSIEDANSHPLIGYVDDLIFTEQLSYLERVIKNPKPIYRSTSVITQYVVTRENLGLAILPCFLAQQDPQLVPILEDEINIIRSFWIAVHPEQKKLHRVAKVWQHLKEYAADNEVFLMGK